MKKLATKLTKISWPVCKVVTQGCNQSMFHSDLSVLGRSVYILGHDLFIFGRDLCMLHATYLCYAMS